MTTYQQAIELRDALERFGFPGSLCTYEGSKDGELVLITDDGSGQYVWGATHAEMRRAAKRAKDYDQFCGLAKSVTFWHDGSVDLKNGATDRLRRRLVAAFPEHLKGYED